MNIQKLFKAAVKHYQAGDLVKAAQVFREIVKVHPRNFDAYVHLGNVLQDTGQSEEALACYLKAAELKPDFAGAYYNIASILQDKGDLDAALTYYRRVVELDPGYADTYNSVGVILQSKGQFDEAMTYFRKAIELDPEFAMAYTNLGNILLKKEYLDDAAACYRKALDLNQNYAKAYCNLGIAIQEKGGLDEAIAHYRKALQLDPNLVGALSNLGRALQSKGRFADAEASYRRAIEARPHDVIPRQNLLLLMLYDPRFDAKTVFSEHLKFGAQFEKPLLSGSALHGNKKTGDRRLRIGYVSPDFRRHSVAYFIEPVLASHNREGFEIFCYSLAFAEDEVTQRLRGYADHWRSIAGIPDAEAAELVRKDGIDILIDLTGHTSNNRILLFARKPAPVQVSWIGYPATTGLSAVDYKIVDAYTDPPGMSEQFYTEKLVRLPESFLCYLPERDTPEVGPLPALSSGCITFGSCNNFAKVSPEVVDLWADILKETPRSRLLMKAKSFSNKSTRDSAAEMFTRKGVASERFEFVSWEPSLRGHLDIYNRIDIALDTFPYNGTTTTCEALWMGAPVITLAGSTHASRVGKSLLANVGLPELVAETSGEYVSIAVNMAGDLERLVSLRGSLRETVGSSPLCSAGEFCRNLERCYREMWENWCKAEKSS